MVILDSLFAGVMVELQKQREESENAAAGSLYRSQGAEITNLIYLLNHFYWLDFIVYLSLFLRHVTALINLK